MRRVRFRIVDALAWLCERLADDGRVQAGEVRGVVVIIITDGSPQIMNEGLLTLDDIDTARLALTDWREAMNITEPERANEVVSLMWRMRGAS